MSGAAIAGLVRQGAVQLANDKTVVNNLNVFPIPDGDTGDNMYMTIESGCSQPGPCSTAGEAAATLSKGMLLGARGNSGVILSRIFAGIAKGLDGVGEADLHDLEKALQCGVEEAYKAVPVPVEGTMLTVYREAVAAANASGSDSFEEYGNIFLKEMEASLERTPELLDVLKKAGVIDSGGAGLVSIARGIMKALYGETTEAAADSAPAAKKIDLDSFTEDSVLEFGYCTEFLLRLQRAKVDPDTFDEKEIIDYLSGVGDSIVCFKDGSIVKVHVHTRTPGDVLSHCQRWGEFLTLKIENMTLQHHETTIKDGFSKPKKRYGIVTVASGEGLENTFTEAGADVVIQGGQTMNPSVQSFLDAFSRTGAEHIFVFPNNSNIIMTAQQAAAMYDRAEVHVMPSKNIGEGYTAIASFDFDTEDPGQLEEGLKEIMAQVVTGMVSTAIRDAAGCKEGDCVGFVGKDILCGGASRKDTVLSLCGKMDAGDRDVALVFYGAEVSPEEAEEISQTLGNQYPMTEFMVASGGQPVYDYIIILT